MGGIKKGLLAMLNSRLGTLTVSKVCLGAIIIYPPPVTSTQYNRTRFSKTRGPTDPDGITCFETIGADIVFVNVMSTGGQVCTDVGMTSPYNGEGKWWALQDSAYLYGVYLLRVGALGQILDLSSCDDPFGSGGKVKKS